MHHTLVSFKLWRLSFFHFLSRSIVFASKMQPLTRFEPNVRRVNIDYATLPINLSPAVTPSSPTESQPTIGLIGMGAMGRMYAQRLGAAGWRKSVDYLWFLGNGGPNVLPWLESMSAICQKSTSNWNASTKVRDVKIPLNVLHLQVRYRIAKHSCDARWTCCRTIIRLHRILRWSRVYRESGCRIWSMYVSLLLLPVFCPRKF